ncbi:MAG: PQQ-like beta-propeller repeat protein [Planctomycetes bacterium]|nr:PQQ-like beta-propeller repeat protein [Planctomycetota bacterium]
MNRFLLCVVILLPASVHADDWPQFLGPRRDGTSAEKGLLDAFPKDGPKIVWQRDVGDGFSGPAIAEGRLVLFHRVDNDEVIECLEAAAGKALWKFAYPTEFTDGQTRVHGPRATPSIVNNRVVTLGAEGMLTCLSLDKGEKIWTRSLTQDYKTSLGYFGIGTSTVIEQGMVLVNVGGKQAGIVAFDLDSGKELWKATGDPGSYASPVVCTIDGARLAVFFTRTGAVVLDPKTGAVRYQQRWRSRMDASVNGASPLVIGDLAFFSSSYDTGALLLKLRKDGAEKVWEHSEIMSNHFNTCIHHDGHLYGFDGRVDSRTAPTLRCFELKTKKMKWEKEDFGNGPMILAEGRLILLTEKGELCLLQATPQAYRELGRVTLLNAGAVRAHPALAGGRLYARDQKKLVCVDLRK